MAIGDGEDILASDILGLVSFEITVGNTHSLTTVADQKVIVFARAVQNGNPSTATLAYNGVTKDSFSGANGANADVPIILTYMETPGAGTEDITVTGSQAVIVVIKLNQA